MKWNKKNKEGGQALHRPGGYCYLHYEPLRAHCDKNKTIHQVRMRQTLKKKKKHVDDLAQKWLDWITSNFREKYFKL